MTATELVEILQLAISVLEAAEDVIKALSGTGVDVSGVKLHTSTPIDMSAFFKAFV